MYNPDEECRALIEKIEFICKQKKITHNILAKKAGISNSTLSYLLHGKSKPYVYTILQICNALELSCVDLFGTLEIERSLNHLSVQEQDLLFRYRNLTDEKKNYLLLFLSFIEKDNDF